ncbi:Nucleoid-associated protein Lsr2 (plasmid) [Rhodococcoides fascians D188]|nr:Nucleoid-associated protein Lsr2 [Rhodococcus fascians D188]
MHTTSNLGFIADHEWSAAHNRTLSILHPNHARRTHSCHDHADPLYAHLAVFHTFLREGFFTVAKLETIQLVDDIDGSVIDDSGETIEFAVQGVEYVIDLKAKNASEFHRKLDYYIKHAARVGGRKRKPFPATASTPSTAGTPAKRDPAQTRAIRQWAADNGHEIGDRGRIPTDIEEAYNAAH